MSGANMHYVSMGSTIYRLTDNQYRDYLLERVNDDQLSELKQTPERAGWEEVSEFEAVNKLSVIECLFRLGRNFPDSVADRHVFVAVGDFIWGKGLTPEEAVLKMKSVNGIRKNKKAPCRVWKCHPGTTVTEMGALSYPSSYPPEVVQEIK